MHPPSKLVLRMLGVIISVSAILEYCNAEISSNSAYIEPRYVSSKGQTSRGLFDAFLPLGKVENPFLNIIGKGNENLCQKLGVGRFPKSGDCSKYMDCSRADVFGFYKSCPDNEKLDALSNTCSLKGRCQDEVCKDLDGKLYEDPTYKKKYYQCVKNKIVGYSCRDGMQYSRLAHACMPPMPLEDMSEEEDPNELSELIKDVQSNKIRNNFRKITKMDKFL